jgi:ABC-type branched-subunit amino acid transport system substrate-binding protein
MQHVNKGGTTVKLRRTWVILGLAACLCATTPLVAASTAGAKPASGTPIKLLISVPLNSQIFTAPEMVAGAEAAAEAINKAGGVNGDPIEIVSCDEKFSPNGAADCARKAESEGVAAVVGSFDGFGSSTVWPILEAAHIPSIGYTPFVGADFTSPVGFPLDGGAVSVYAGGGMQLVKAGCKNVGVFATTEGANQGVDFYKSGAEYAGGTSANFETSLLSPDWPPQVQSAISKDSDCGAFAGPPSLLPGLVQAITSSGAQFKHFQVAESTLGDVVADLGSSVEGDLATSAFVPVTATTNSGVKKFTKEMKAHDPDATRNVRSEQAWASVYVFAQVAAGLPEVTAQAVLDKMSTLTAAKTYLTDPIDFTKTNTNTSIARIFNTKVYFEKVKDGKIVLAKKKPVDTQPAVADTQQS